MISKLEHQHHRKYCWYPKRQLMFLFCLEQEQMLLQKDRLQEKRNLKSPEISFPRKDTITNQDITIIITQQYPNLPPNLSKGPNGHKPFIDDTHFSNPTENKHSDTTDNLRTDKKESVDKMNVYKDEDKDNKYKKDSPESPKSD